MKKVRCNPPTFERAAKSATKLFKFATSNAVNVCWLENNRGAECPTPDIGMNENMAVRSLVAAVTSLNAVSHWLREFVTLVRDSISK